MKTNIAGFVIFVMSIIGCYLMLTGSIQAGIIVGLSMVIAVCTIIIVHLVQVILKEAY